MYKFSFKPCQVYGNAKTKVYADGTTNTVYCRSPIFKKPLFEKSEYKERSWSVYTNHMYKTFHWLEEKDNFKYNLTFHLPLIKEHWGVSDIYSLSYDDIQLAKKCIFRKRKKRKTGEPRSDSMKRAKNSIFDYTFNNRFDYFFTGTIDPKKYNSKDPKKLLKPLQNWLKDRVKRDGFQYIFVAEYHKKGGIHFHGLIKADKLRLVDSGTKSYRGFKKPMKDHTAIRKGFNPADGQVIYNLPAWKFGFTTCIKTYGEPLNVAYYITKYITKDCKKIFGKFFWHSFGLKKPEVHVHDVDYDSIEAVEFKGAYKYKFMRLAERERIAEEKFMKAEYGEIYCDLNGLMTNIETGEVYYDDLNIIDLSDYETILE